MKLSSASSHSHIFFYLYLVLIHGTVHVALPSRGQAQDVHTATLLHSDAPTVGAGTLEMSFGLYQQRGTSMFDAHGSSGVTDPERDRGVTLGLVAGLGEDLDLFLDAGWAELSREGGNSMRGGGWCDVRAGLKYHVPVAPLGWDIALLSALDIPCGNRGSERAPGPGSGSAVVGQEILLGRSIGALYIAGMAGYAVPVSAVREQSADVLCGTSIGYQALPWAKFCMDLLYGHGAHRTHTHDRFAAALGVVATVLDTLRLDAGVEWTVAGKNTVRNKQIFARLVILHP
jgi:hypothetical protein